MRLFCRPLQVPVQPKLNRPAAYQDSSLEKYYYYASSLTYFSPSHPSRDNAMCQSTVETLDDRPPSPYI